MFSLLLVVIYLSFISLGLPDALLGSAWPEMYAGLGVPLSYAGIISMIISLGTILSSFVSARMTRWLGAGKITAISVGMTAIALFGFSTSHSFVLLCLWAIPYGLGAGNVDAALNNYVALHYASSHMSWLHCMWGIGASVGPYIMGYAISAGPGWNSGYRYIAIMQVVLTFIIVMSLPMWKNDTGDEDESGKKEYNKVLSLKQIIRIPGAREIMITFFCYCALEQTAGLWCSSYLVLHNGVSTEQAAKFASLFFLGITFGRGVSGFIAMKLNDVKMIRMGQIIALVGICALFIPGSDVMAEAGLIIIGLGCAPIYPSIIHSTPENFGKDRSQAMIGIQMASAYVGTCTMPTLFGVIAQHINIGLLSVYLLILLIVMMVMHAMAISKSKKNNNLL